MELEKAVLPECDHMIKGEKSTKTGDAPPPRCFRWCVVTPGSVDALSWQSVERFVPQIHFK
jgi:hypothetical protein